MYKRKYLLTHCIVVLLTLSIFGCDSDILAPPAPGLLMNPGAEDGMHHWEYTEPIVRSVDEAVQSEGNVLPRSGNFFFDMTGANVLEDSVVFMRQSVSVENDRGMPFTAGGWIQSELWPDENKTDVIDNDYGELVIVFIDAGGTVLDSLTTGPIGNPVRGYPETNGREYDEFVLTGTIPMNAVTGIYELRGYLIQGLYINVFYDDLYLRIE